MKHSHVLMLVGLLWACEPRFGPEDSARAGDDGLPEEAREVGDASSSGDVPSPGDPSEPHAPDPSDLPPISPPGDLPAIPEAGPLPEEHFATPQGVAVVERHVVVVNSAFRYDGQRMTFAMGFLTVVDRESHRVAQRVALPCRNPQEASWDGSRLWVLCSGETSFDGTLVRPAGPGALVGLDRVGDLYRVVAFLPIPPASTHPLVGYPSSMALRDQRAVLGCGTTAALLVADLARERMIRSTDRPWSLASLGLGGLEEQDTIQVRAGPPGILLVGSFNQDRVLVLRDDGDEPSFLGSFELGVPGMLDGVLDLAWRSEGSPELYVLLGLAQRVVAVSDPLGAPRLDQRFVVTGTMPNRILLDGHRLWVLDSGDNRVAAFDADTGRPLGLRAKMPPGTNPYGMAVGAWEGRRELYVTGLLSGSLWVFDAESGDLLTEVR